MIKCFGKDNIVYEFIFAILLFIKIKHKTDVLLTAQQAPIEKAFALSLEKAVRHKLRLASTDTDVCFSQLI